LPENDTDYSMRWGLIKKECTKRARHILNGMLGITVGEAHPTQGRGTLSVGAAHPTEDGAADPNVGWAVPTGRAGTQRDEILSTPHATKKDRPDYPNVGWAAPTDKPPRPTASRIKHREGAVWQRRFWEHQIRDQEDFNAHVEYIHFNPVKHGLAKAPIEWTYSSFGRYVKDGIYERDWGAGGGIAFDDGVGNE
jgi:hypothetical protein